MVLLLCELNGLLPQKSGLVSQPRGFDEEFWASLVAQVLKNLTASAGDTGDLGSNSGSGRSPGGRNGNPLQCSSLENSMDKGT